MRIPLFTWDVHCTLYIGVHCYQGHTDTLNNAVKQSRLVGHSLVNQVYTSSQTTMLFQT